MATAKPVLFAGNSNRPLAEEIAQRMGSHLGNALVTTFANEECRVEIRENVRGADAFVVQSLCKPLDGNRSVNDSLVEMLLMIDALRRASAYRITAVIPYYGYAKQDKKTKGREPITAKLVANLLQTAGVQRVLTVDLHAAQIQGFFDEPVDNLTASFILANYLMNHKKLSGPSCVVVSPDAGGVARAETFARKLQTSVAIVFKRRPKPDVNEVSEVVGELEGKTAIIIDDMISTGGTLVKAAEALLNRGAISIVTCATHGIFAADAAQKLIDSPITEIVVTNTIPVPEAVRGTKIKVLSVGKLLADTIKRISLNRSVSEIYEQQEIELAESQSGAEGPLFRSAGMDVPEIENPPQVDPVVGVPGDGLEPIHIVS
ncbi:MAG: ribose-phosphate diphosphokinase [Candidatus Eremiobacter antarcticus]|nr:ribose-phosphate pyrophosphokinase [Candidatus Eremiobacteraeota bacterium]MBC5808055.1 ribose-phosphate pyrophosphokinase [Candidatus Eremiobacteraeota bacterium]PZR63459.1 MAG: ribose-phosphate diphosphokinase [Candidatus Eremiobacter sp. RRmetagenome_bin22]